MALEFDGQKYKKASTHQKEWGVKLIGELELKGDEWILDLGCGDGSLTAQLADLVPKGRVLGIDGSKSMIETAEKHQRDNLSFMVKDINHLDFKDEFNIVFSNAALHWIKDHAKLLQNTRTCLRENGVLRFNFAADGNCSHFFKVIKIAMARPEYRNYFKDFVWPWFMPEVEAYDAFLKQCPFREIKVWGEIADRYFPNTETMIKWLDQPSLVPLLKSVDQADKRSFRDFVVGRMVAETRQPDGTCFETFRRVNVFARK